MLKEAGIPMFGFDTQVGDMSYLTSYAGSDNYNAGYVCVKTWLRKFRTRRYPCTGFPDHAVCNRQNQRIPGRNQSSPVLTFNVVGQQDAQVTSRLLTKRHRIY